MLERDLQKSCLNRLALWELKKVVIYYLDLSQFGVRYIRGRYIKRTKKGLPDIVAYVKYNGVCAICFFELKTLTKQSDHQIAFMNKFKDITNVWYDIITEPAQVDDRIEDVTGFYASQLREMSNGIN
jgi:hypothetical protein